MSFVQTTPRKLSAAAWHSSSLAQLLVSLSTVLIDILVLLISSTVTGIAYHLWAYQSMGEGGQQLTLGLLTAAIFVGISSGRGQYRLFGDRKSKKMFAEVAQGWLLTVFLVLLVGFLSKSTSTFSRAWVSLFFGFGFFALIAGRLILARIFSSAIESGLIAKQQVILVGDAPLVDRFLDNRSDRSLPVNIVNVFYLPENPSHLEECLSRAVASARRLTPDSILLAVSLEDTFRIKDCLNQLSVLPSSVSLLNDGLLSSFKNVEINQLGNFARLLVVRPPLSLPSLIVKRGFDFFVSLLLLAALSPLFVLVAILIKWDSKGPVFFKQRRYGFTQRPFNIYKFRSMSVAEDGRKITQAQVGDSRITKIGGWLRKTNIDELPQLINVLLGQMSLVGPRPHAMVHDHQFDRLIADYAGRQKVKPGITGWAQVNGWRGVTDTDEKIRGRVEHDIYYINNWSLELDIRILLLTIFSKKAYRNAV